MDLIDQQMIIGSGFGKKNQKFLKEVGKLSKEDTNLNIAVVEINKALKLDRTEVKNILEFLQDLGYIDIVSIGGPLLYGHIKITEEGLSKYREIIDQD